MAAGVKEPSSVMIAMREVREIYHQGVWAVAAAFRQLYEMIEVEDGRVQQLVAAATCGRSSSSGAHQPSRKRVRG
jgi:hypothetical protein